MVFKLLRKLLFTPRLATSIVVCAWLAITYPDATAQEKPATALPSVTIAAKANRDPVE